MRISGSPELPAWCRHRGLLHDAISGLAPDSPRKAKRQVCAGVCVPCHASSLIHTGIRGGEEKTPCDLGDLTCHTSQIPSGAVPPGLNLVSQRPPLSSEVCLDFLYRNPDYPNFDSFLFKRHDHRSLSPLRMSRVESGEGDEEDNRHIVRAGSLRLATNRNPQCRLIA